MGYQVNIGCGRSPTEGWRNFDNTPAIGLANSAIKYSLAKFLGILTDAHIENIEWHRRNSIEFADATKRIPLPDNSVSSLYSSHMIEHLSREDAQTFLKEAKRVLKKGGLLRIAIPDLSVSIARYNKDKDADKFMDKIKLSPPPLSSLKDKIKLLVIGYRDHQWMYDGASMSRLLTDMGFKGVTVQESGFTLIENPGALNLDERDDANVYVEGIN